MISGQVKYYLLAALRVNLGADTVLRMMLKRNFRHYEKAGAIFIHIPKCAGTSVSTSLYGHSLGHFRALDLFEYSQSKFLRLEKFAILRDPVERAYSAWSYARNGGTTEGWIKPDVDFGDPEFRTFESFAENWLPSRSIDELDNVFRSQASYVTDIEGGLLIDELVPLPMLDVAWSRLVQNTLPTADRLLKLNRGGEGKTKKEWPQSVLDSLNHIYSEDASLYQGSLKRYESIICEDKKCYGAT